MGHPSIVCCAVSGSVPEEPVVNRNNGQLFEKRLVEKHLKVNFLSSAPICTSTPGLNTETSGTHHTLNTVDLVVRASRAES